MLISEHGTNNQFPKKEQERLHANFSSQMHSIRAKRSIEYSSCELNPNMHSVPSAPKLDPISVFDSKTPNFKTKKTKQLRP